MNAGSFVWVRINERETKWLPGVVKEIENDSITVLVSKTWDSPTDVVDEGDLFTMNLLASDVVRGGLDGCMGIPDFVKLTDMSTPALLNSLRVRYTRDEIYSNIGSILIALNPYREIPETYSRKKLQEISVAAASSKFLPPHVYSVAAIAYHNLLRTQKNQSILISGESGAGKTETTKHILRFLASASARVSAETMLKTLAKTKGSYSSVNTKIEKQIMNSNPILEAFGNAQTLRNKNSSRFGKFIEVRFDEQGRVVGAEITSYLLEKSRVAGPSRGEKNFHVFYYLCCGATKEEKQQFKLSDCSKFHYLVPKSKGKENASRPLSPEERAVYRSNFNALRESLETCGISKKQQSRVWRVLSAILHIGNITFKRGTSSGSEAALISNEECVTKAANLLGVPLEEMKASIITRTIKRPGKFSTVYVKHLTIDQARSARDGLSKALYASIFSWILRLVNVSMSSTGKFFIGVLDIFGFEVFDQNSFEQLCINFANESLHRFFHSELIEVEKTAYAEQGIDIGEFTFPDNTPVIDLFRNKTSGIFSMIDEECILPKGSEEQFLHKVTKSNEDNPVFFEVKASPSHFGVHHYAGDVAYTTVDILTKNRDDLSSDIEYLKKTKDPWIRNLAIMMKDSPPPPPNASRVHLGEGASGVKGLPAMGTSSQSQARTKPTLGRKFQNSLSDLMSLLTSTNPHFIRCLKPNNSQVPSLIDSTEILRQMSYSGLLETVRFRSCGYPVRMKCIEAWNSFRLLGFDEDGGVLGHISTKQVASQHNVVTNLKPRLEKLLVEILDDHADDFTPKRSKPFAIGKSLIFFTNEFEMFLRSLISIEIVPWVIDLQRCVRGWIGRKQCRILQRERERKRDIVRRMVVLRRYKLANAKRVEAARLEAARLEAARLEAIRIEKERQEAIRQEAIREEKERLDALEAENARKEAMERQRQNEEAHRLKMLEEEARRLKEFEDATPPPPPPPPSSSPLVIGEDDEIPPPPPSPPQRPPLPSEPAPPHSPTLPKVESPRTTRKRAVSLASTSDLPSIALQKSAPPPAADAGGMSRAEIAMMKLDALEEELDAEMEAEASGDSFIKFPKIFGMVKTYQQPGVSTRFHPIRTSTATTAAGTRGRQRSNSTVSSVDENLLNFDSLDIQRKISRTGAAQVLSIWGYGKKKK